jgi:phosphohistidine phosphatase
MSLYLVQHGRSLSKEVDPERGVSEEGIAETIRIAGVAKGYQVPVSKILHSGKKRAAQTAALFAEALAPPQGVEQIAGLKPLDDVETLVPRLDSGANLMLVGHLPFMEKLVCRLTTGNTGHTVFKFQNSGIVCLDREEAGNDWFVKWALMPTIT